MKVGAILPAAGRGKRMASITGGGAKELLKIGDRTVLDLVLQEAHSVADHLVVVTSPAKPEIQEHLGDTVLMAEQAEPRGFAHAVRIGVQALPDCDIYLVLLPDTLFPPPGPITSVRQALEKAEVAIAAEIVTDEDVHRYGILETAPGSTSIVKILEKPSPSETASRLAVSARYGFSRRFSDFLQEACDQHGPEEKELSLTPVIGRAIQLHSFEGVAMPIDGHRYDCGDPLGYAQAEEAYR